MRVLIICLFKLLLFVVNVGLHAEDSHKSQIKTMQAGGHILMIRHANAPGYGDPDNIKIGDCSTQRNLDERGRKQSAKIGKWLESNNIEPSAIYSSQWCRCLDTAQLLGLGAVKELSSLNSFFQMSQNRESSLRNLRQFISKQTTDNRLIIMVTHNITISAISGQNVAPGDGVLLKLNKSSPYEFISVLSTDID